MSALRASVFFRCAACVCVCLSRVTQRRGTDVVLFVCRAVQVWKSVVPNTGRALREILTTLTTQVVNFLASDNSDNVGIASRCLGDIVKKLGERVLPEIVPTLREVCRQCFTTRVANVPCLSTWCKMFASAVYAAPCFF